MRTSGTHPRPRPSGWAALVIAFAALSVLVPLTPTRGAVTRESGRRTITVPAPEGREALSLPDNLVLAGSDTVRVDGVLYERGKDYVLDHVDGTIAFVRDVPDTSVVSVKYLYVAIGLRELYRHAVLESMPGRDELPTERPQLVATAEMERESEPLPAGLSIGGAKSFGVTVGSNRDLALEQSLRLSVSGNVTRDVALNAYLSDQNTPLTPEGDTEELRSLDKVLVEIEGESASATLGDYELVVGGGKLASFNRELTGVMLEGRHKGFELTLAGARSAGEFMTVTMRGLDGKQGPYFATDHSGGAGVSVVPGSETVWMDGVRLRRGRDNDYIIDYVDGSVEFTEARHITDETVITMDYEYTVEDFDRDIYGGRLEYRSKGESAALGVSFLKEVDDRGSAATAVLGDEQLAILQDAGDDPKLAHDDGVDFVGPGNGDYLLDPGGFFYHAGPDSGEYDLHFERHEGGDYSYNFEEAFYYHAGPGQGTHRLGLSLPLAREFGLVAFDGTVRLGEKISVAAEAALSSLDRNTFSDLDDEDNLGNAESITARASKLGLPLSGADLSLDLLARRVSAQFGGASRFRDATYEDEWGLEGLELSGEELLGEAAATIGLDGGGTLTLSQGSLNRGEELESRKTEFVVDGNPVDALSVAASVRVIDLRYDVTPDSTLERARDLYRAGLKYIVGFVQPGVDYRHDSRTSREAAGESGERFDEYGVSLETVGRLPVTLGVRYSHRTTDRILDAGWDSYSATRTQEYKLASNRWEKLIFDGRLVRRAVEHERGIDAADGRYDLAKMALTHRSFDGGLTGEVRYSVTTTEVERKERHEVEENGTTTTELVPTGEYVPVTDLTASTKWRLRLSRAGSGRGQRDLPEPSAWKRFLSSLSFETSIKLREMTETTEKARLYLLDPAVLRGPDTVNGELSARHVARYLAPGGAFSIRATVSTRDDLDRRYTNAKEERRERSGSLDVKFSRPSHITYRLIGKIGAREREIVGLGDSYAIDERSISGEVRARRLGDFEAGFELEVRREDEDLDDLNATTVSGGPSVTYRITGRGAITGSYSRIQVEASADDVPTYLAGGRRPGVSSEWRLTGDYRLNRYLTASLNYFGEARAESEARHTMDMRIDAYF